MGDCRIDVPPEALEELNTNLIIKKILRTPEGSLIEVSHSKTQGEAVQGAIQAVVKLIQECNDGGLDSERVFRILKKQFPELISDNSSMKEEENMTPEAP